MVNYWQKQYRTQKRSPPPPPPPPRLAQATTPSSSKVGSSFAVPHKHVISASYPALASHADVLRLVEERVTSLRTSAWEATPAHVHEMNESHSG